MQEVDSAEFVEWMVYFELDPFGEDRADFRSAIIAATIANTQSTKRRFTPKDFMPQWGQRVAPKPQQTLDQQRSIFEAFVMAQNQSVGVAPNGAMKG